MIAKKRTPRTSLNIQSKTPDRDCIQIFMSKQEQKKEKKQAENFIQATLESRNRNKHQVIYGTSTKAIKRELYCNAFFPTLLPASLSRHKSKASFTRSDCTPTTTRTGKDIKEGETKLTLQKKQAQ